MMSGVLTGLLTSLHLAAVAKIRAADMDHMGHELNPFSFHSFSHFHVGQRGYYKVFSLTN